MKIEVHPVTDADIRKHCCCNCHRNIRTKEADGYVRCNCEIDGHYIGYVECFEGWCKHWKTHKRGRCTQNVPCEYVEELKGADDAQDSK